MSRSKKWRLEWSFFLGENGRRRYNSLSPLPVRTLEKVCR